MPILVIVSGAKNLLEARICGLNRLFTLFRVTAFGGLSAVSDVASVVLALACCR